MVTVADVVLDSDAVFVGDEWRWWFGRCRSHVHLFSALTLLVRRQEGHQACKNLGVGLLAVTFWLEFCTPCSSSCQLSPPPPSSLAAINSRMETFWYQLTQIQLEKWPLILIQMLIPVCSSRWHYRGITLQEGQHQKRRLKVAFLAYLSCDVMPIQSTYTTCKPIIITRGQSPVHRQLVCATKQYIGALYNVHNYEVPPEVAHMLHYPSTHDCLCPVCAPGL